MNTLLTVSLRKNAIYSSKEGSTTFPKELSQPTIHFLQSCNQLGYTFSEELLRVIIVLSAKEKADILDVLKQITGVNKNWTPLVKQWNIPTGESIVDHISTFLANVLPNTKDIKGTSLPCGHTIPDNTFPIERYNGCPFCGTPFTMEKLNYEPNKNKLKVLELWTETDAKNYLANLLASPVALDATQIDDLSILLAEFGYPKNVEIRIKETKMMVIDYFVSSNQAEKANQLFTTPNDILRYLWYKHTGFLQIVEPKVIIKRKSRNAQHIHLPLDKREEAKQNAKEQLKLKFTRVECKRYANWFNNLEGSVQEQCENMHPKRTIWVRVIRALRLAEYSKKSGFEQLREVLDAFYNEKYEVWQGKVNHYKLKNNAEQTFQLLKQRPGLFARSLFATMIWFGEEITIKHFKEIMHKVPDRLIFTLYMYAETYFDKNALRTVKPLGGTTKTIPANQFLQFFSEEDLEKMIVMVKELCIEVIRRNFGKEAPTNSTMFIAEELYNIPLSIGDRNEQLQDGPSALMGTRFKVEGDRVRLFLQWGEGLPAQHLDMDLSCIVAFNQNVEYCSYSNLVALGCKHSGDIQHIPNKVGTAEYIEINLNELQQANAKYVAFTCNAYSGGSIEPNVVVGWMNSNAPMDIRPSGVAYNPTDVQHQVRFKRSLTKGLLFGILEVETAEIIWLEMDFAGQVVQNLRQGEFESFLNKLDAKLKIGELLEIKAEVQGVQIVDSPEQAEEVYDTQWAMNTANVSALLMNN